MQDEKIIISLGGSIIVPEEINIDFLKAFKELILSHIAKGKKFIIITGGGYTNKKYNEAAKKLSDPSQDDLDWIGIAALKLNAELVRVMFTEKAHEKVIYDFSDKLSSDQPIIVGAAYEPGKSSDWDAILAARTFGAKRVINLSNIDHVYDSDPRENPNAKKIEKISWADYRKIIPESWSARLNSPFDPIASKDADEAGIEVAILNGKNIANLDKCLNGENFAGTLIR